MGVGLIIAALGFVTLTRVDGSSGLAVVAISTVVLSLGLSPVFTLANDLIIGTAPPERAGAAAGISETCSEFGGALGIAILGSVGTAIYRGTMAVAVPAGIPAELADAARDTLGGAVAAAARLPDLGPALLDTARAAFTSGLRITALISALIAIGMAVLVLRFLRSVRSSAEPAQLTAATA